MINIKDANGNWVCIKPEDFTEATMSNLDIVFGMSMDNLLYIKRLYELKGGTHPMTQDSINEVFIQRG